MKNQDKVISKDVVKELETLNYLEQVMMTPSVSPNAWEMWENIKDELMKNRGLIIEWEKIELIENRGERSYLIRGEDREGRKYEALGRYEGDSLEKVEDIEEINVNAG